MEYPSYQEQIPVKEKQYDMIVAGGGVAGLAAAQFMTREKSLRQKT